MTLCEEVIAEVISLKSGLGCPGENFIPFLYYSAESRGL